MVTTHALRPKSGQIWEKSKSRFGQNSARKTAFELKIFFGCGIRLKQGHVKFGSIWARSKNSTFGDPPQKGTFWPKSSVGSPCTYVCLWDLKMLILVGRSKKCFWVNSAWLSVLRHSWGVESPSYSPKMALLAEIGQNRILKVHVQAGKNRNFGTSQTGTCGRLLVMRFCLQTN